MIARPMRGTRPHDLSKLTVAVNRRDGLGLCHALHITVAGTRRAFEVGDLKGVRACGGRSGFVAWGRCDKACGTPSRSQLRGLRGEP